MSNLRCVNKKTELFKKRQKENIISYKKLYIEHFNNKIMSLETFNAIWGESDSDRKCGYCGISENQIKELCIAKKIITKRFYSRGKTMEMDKIDPNGEYNKDNIVLSCYWCNNAKTDEFNVKEFKFNTASDNHS